VEPPIIIFTYFLFLTILGGILLIGGLYSGHVWMEVLVLVCSKLTPKLNTLEPNTCVSLVLVGTNTPKKLTPPRGTLFSLPLLFSNDWKSYFKCKLTPPSKHARC
jgi:hypothetical protein